MLKETSIPISPPLGPVNFFQERTKRERGRDVKWKLDLNHRFSGGVPSNINLKHFLVLNLTVIEALEGLKKRNQ